MPYLKKGLERDSKQKHYFLITSEVRLFRDNMAYAGSHLYNGEDFYRNNQYEKAIKEFCLALEEQPGSRQLILEKLGECCYKIGNRKKAFEYFAEVYLMDTEIQEDSVPKRGSMILDEWFIEKGINDAMDLCNCLKRKWPNDKWLTLKKDELERLESEINERIRKRREPEDEGQNQAEFVIMEPICGSCKNTEEKNNNKKTACNYYNKGNGYYKSGDYEGALQEYNMAILFYPDFKEAYFNRGIIYYKLGNYLKALDEFKKAGRDEQDYKALNNKACIYHLIGKYENAIEIFNSIISLNERYTKAYHNLALAYFQISQYKKTIENLEKAIKSNHEFVAKSFYARAAAYEEMGKNEDAINDYEKAFSLNLRNNDLLFRLGNLKDKMNGTEEKEAITEENGLIDAKQYCNKPKINFSHVGGMEEVKEIINTELIHPLKNKKLAERYGKRIGRGILFYGPPGCGKSLLAEAIAGEAELNFISANISSILNMYVGNSEKNLSLIFEEAKNNQPSVLFFDEIEGLGGKREGMRQRFERNLVNQFLLEMDKIEKNNCNVLVMGATNMPWEVDNALRRSGRFGKAVFIYPPDEKARIEVLKIHTKNIELLEELDYKKLAKALKGFSCANIKSVCENAVNIPWKEAYETGKMRKAYMRDFLKAIESEKSDVKEWFEIVKQYNNDYLFKENYEELVKYMENEYKVKNEEGGMFG